MASNIIAEPDTFYVLADDTLTVGPLDGILENDFDTFAGPPVITATSFSSPAHGKLSVSIDGSLTYTPTPGFVGADTFTYFVSDGTHTASAIDTIDVIKPFLTAAPDTFLTHAGTTLTLDAAQGLLANDLSGAGAIVATAFSSPAHGSLSVSLDGSVTYTPDAGFVGTDTFTYFISNGHGTASATATVDVIDAPPVASPDAYAVQAGETLTISAAQGLLANDFAPGATLTATSFSAPAHGTLNVSIDGSLSYVPDAGFVGVDTFTYYVSDGSVTASAVATIDVVGQPPVAAADFYRVGENTKLTVPAASGLLANDFDADGGAIVATSFSSPAHGSLEVSLDGSITYTPAANYIGADSFTYYISDGGLVSSAVVSLEDGESAVIANPDTFHDNEGQQLIVSAAHGLLANDYPGVGKSSLVATAFSDANHGTLSVSLDGSLTYTPNAGFVGADTFTYYISDGAHSTSAVATIDVAAPDLVAEPDAYVVREDGVLEPDLAHGLLTNDLAASGSIVATAFSQPAHGALSVSLDGTLTYTPNAGYVGVDTFSYFIEDGSQTASTTVSIDVVNEAPVANPDIYSTRAGQGLVVDAAQGLLANDAAFGGSVTATSFSRPAHGDLSVSLDGSLTYTPDAGFVGADTFTYYISDGAQTASTTATIDVVATDPPLAANEYFHVTENTKLTVAAANGLLTKDFDPDGVAITASSFSSPSHGSLSVSLDGSLTYTPAADYLGTDSFSYFISDGTGTASATAYFDVTMAPPCFVTGTHILTARGEIPVEDLTIGDHVVLASGGVRPIVWIGRRSLDTSRHPSPADIWPVRVSRHAFADNLPHRDLWLSPGHNLACEGMLIAVARLVNDRSVAQRKRDRVEYWHVELDAHDVLLAEGLPAESYLDTGNRTAFANGGAFVEAHPNFKPRHWAQTCLPHVFEGPAIAGARAKLLARLAQVGGGVTHDADVHVRVDDLRVEPLRLGAKKFAFVLPAGGREIALWSRTFVPAHSVAESDDSRTLGLCVGALEIDGDPIVLPDDKACAQGWHIAEYEGDTFTHRWSKGATPLPSGARIVILDLAGTGLYRTASSEQPDAVALGLSLTTNS